MKNFTFNAIFWLFILAVPLVINAQTSYIDSLEVDSKIRLYKYTEPRENDGTARIVIVLHGSGMSMDFMEEVVGGQFNALANNNKSTIMVYPEGYQGNWNDCRAKATYPAKKHQIDDVGFILKILNKLENQFKLQAVEVFAVGYSNGGHMCFKLAKQIPEKFKGFAVVGANLPVAENNDCTNKNEPVSLLLINGTTDPINPFNGGAVWSGDGQIRGHVLSAQETLEYWLNLLTGNPVLESELHYDDIYPEDNSMAVQRTYASPGSPNKVSTLEISNGGHHFANPDFKKWPDYLGNLNQDVNLPVIILSFFDTL